MVRGTRAFGHIRLPRISQWPLPISESPYQFLLLPSFPSRTPYFTLYKIHPRPPIGAAIFDNNSKDNFISGALEICTYNSLIIAEE